MGAPDGAAMTAETVASVVARLIDGLAPSGIPYAFGGAVALSAWSEPRATAHLDVALFLDPARVGDATSVIRSAGVVIDEDAARAEAQARGMFVGHAGLVRIDVFVPSISFDRVAEARRVPMRIAGRETFVHSPEVLAVFKLLFYRPKDLLDVERMLQIRGDAFDRAFVRRALAEMLPDDPRIESWDEICARNPLPRDTR
jgi:hypothetical protein